MSNDENDTAPTLLTAEQMRAVIEATQAMLERVIQAEGLDGKELLPQALGVVVGTLLTYGYSRGVGMARICAACLIAGLGAERAEAAMADAIKEAPMLQLLAGTVKARLALSELANKAIEIDAMLASVKDTRS